MKNCYGKNVLITGASGGIGRAAAEAFAKAGCRVLGVSRHCRETLEIYDPARRGFREADPLKEAGRSGMIAMRRLDVTDEAAVEHFAEKLGGVDIAVLCAGMGVAGPVESLPSEMARLQMEVNYFGTLNMLQAVLPHMRKRGHGLVIVIGSIAGRVSIPMQSHYSASKYALEATVDALRVEMRRFGVRAVIVEPGDTKTGFTDARKKMDAGNAKQYGARYEKSVAKMEKDERGGRSPESVAAVCLRLAGRKEPPARVPVGLEYKALMQLLRVMPDGLREEIVRLLYLPD